VPEPPPPADVGPPAPPGTDAPPPASDNPPPAGDNPPPAGDNPPLVGDDPPLPPGGALLGDDPPWEAWPPAEVARRLASVSVPWCIAAGWALDLFRGEVTREHGDLEIAVPAAGFAAIRAALPDLEFGAVGSGRIYPLDHPAFGLTWQTWGRSRDSGIYRIDVFREPHDGGTWICRRDERIRRPYDTLILHTADQIPYLAPEVALLFKAKHRLPKDVADFTGVLPLLPSASRAWLAGALQRLDPHNPWLAALT
jgi:hypothetical protein